MGHTHGRKWSEETIRAEIIKTMNFFGIDTMPTRKMFEEYYQGTGLIEAISRNGGVIKWAELLGVEHKGLETSLGEKYEEIIKNELIKRGYQAERMKRRYPYDILVDSVVKVDVKVARIYKCSNGKFHTFNLEKENPTCDIYIACCLDNEELIERTYIVPAVKLTGKTQLTVGKKSIYDKYLNTWNLIDEYIDFYAKYAV